MFPNLGSSEQEAAIIVGFFLPLLLAIPMQDHWPDTIRTLFSVGAYAGAGAIVASTAGTLTGKSFWQATLEVLTLGVVGYQGVWKPSGVAPAIEAATSTKPPSSQAPATPPPAGPIPGAPAPAATDTGVSSSGLEPQIGELLSASVKLLEHATQRIAGPAPEPATARPAAQRPQLQTPATSASTAAPTGQQTGSASVGPTDELDDRPGIVDAIELTDRSGADGASHASAAQAPADVDSAAVHAPAPSISDVGAAPVSPTGPPHEHTTTVQRW
jgi:hypothetical protein